jgi:hypothetical protein
MSVSPIDRKLAYLQELASEQGIDLSMLRLGSLLTDLYLSIDFNCLFRFWLDMYLNLDLQLDFTDFNWWNFDFGKFGFNFVLPESKKGIYGKSYYNDFMYDPPRPKSIDLENSMWWMRKHTTETDKPFHKQFSVSIKSYLETIKERLQERGVADFYTDAMESLLAMVEGKVFNCAIVGFAIVGFARVMPAEEGGTSSYQARKHTDWKTFWNLRTCSIFDSVVGIAMVGFTRVGSINLKPSTAMVERFHEQVKEFKERAGKVAAEYPFPAYPPYAYGYAPPAQPYAPVKPEVLYPRVFMLQRVDEYHYNGGHYQLQTQILINKVKQMLNKEGIVAQQRMSYIAYAQELFYIEHPTHRKWKRWKEILSKEDLRKKYIAMGMDEAILSKIEDIVR